MCWLHEINTENNNIQEGMDNMVNGNGTENRRFVKNWQLIAGLLVYSVTMILKHTIGLHDFFQGFGTGLSIVLILFGFLTSAGKSACSLIKGRRKLAEGDVR